MHIVVLGAGAVGGYFGGRLAQSGTPVTFLVREGRYQQLSRRGLNVQSAQGDFSLIPTLATSTDEIENPDIVIVALKNYHLDGAISQLRSLVQKGAIILPLLNGVEHMDRLVSEFGEDAVVGGTCFIEATLSEDGDVVHTSPMHDIIFGSLSASSHQENLLGQLEAAFTSTNVPARLSPRIMVEMWQKFLFLTSFSGITAATRKPIGDILDDEVALPFLEDMLNEVIAVARSQVSGLPEDAAQQVLGKLSSVSKSMTSSLHRDLEKGLPLEIDSLQGSALRMAEAKGIPVPCVRSVYALLHPSKNGRS